VETGTSIIPAAIFYTNEVLPTHRKFFFWPQKVEMHFLPAVTVTGKTSQQVKEEVFTSLKNYLLTRQ
jgi:1-acyl-sn-glycerol-3-phosphate acyltransferase